MKVIVVNVVFVTGSYSRLPCQNRFCRRYLRRSSSNEAHFVKVHGEEVVVAETLFETVFVKIIIGEVLFVQVIPVEVDVVKVILI